MTAGDVRHEVVDVVNAQQEPADGQRSDTFSEYFAARDSWSAFLGSILLGAPALLFTLTLLFAPCVMAQADARCCRRVLSG